MKRTSILKRIFGGPRKGDAERDGDAASSERQEMIRGVQELPETAVKEVMVPRIDVVFLPVDADREQIVSTAIGCGHSRIPIYRETADDVVGVLYVKDLLGVLARGEDISLEKIVRKPFFVPESKRIDALLREFKRRHVHIAVAIDEYGGVSGIVCLEDIIEEIVGEIQDEFDDERDDIVPLGDSAWLCDARVNVADLNEEIGTDLPEDEFDTLGGFVFDLFGKIPARYEKASWKGMDFVIQDMDGHKITSVKLVRGARTEES